jgi:hypothetical protein
MREQRAEHVYIPRRASAAAQTTEQPVMRRESPAPSPHQVGHWAGLYPEDQPQQTRPPRTMSYGDWAEDDEDSDIGEEEGRSALPTARLRPSAIRRDVVPSRKGRYLPASQYQECPPQHRHVVSTHPSIRVRASLWETLAPIREGQRTRRRERMSRQQGILEETPHDTGDELLEERSFPGEELFSNEHDATHAGSPAPEELEAPHAEEDTTPPSPIPRVVEGGLVESILLSEAAAEETDPGTGTATTSPPSTAQPSHRTRLVHAGVLLTAWLIPILLVQLVPGLAGPLAHVVPGLLPSATVTTVPISEEVHLTSAITAVPGNPDERRHEVGARLLSVTTPAVAQTVPTTGTGRMPATHATGTVTFYNEATYAQTITAGTVLTGADGVHIVTKTAAFIPAGNPPSFGVSTVAAYALLTGPGGNIAAFDLDRLCCAASVAVKNTMAFTGGQRARDFAAVAQRDVAQVAGPLTATLSGEAQTSFAAEVRPNEQSVRPAQCAPTVHPDHPVGSEATQVMVTVVATCRGEVYDAQGAKVLAATLLAQQATRTLWSSYEVIGDITTQMVQVRTVDAQRSTLLLSVSAEGIWRYPLSATRLHQFASLIAGHPRCDHYLLRRQREHAAHEPRPDQHAPAHCGRTLMRRYTGGHTSMIPKHDPSREHQPDNHDEEQTDDIIVHFPLAGLLPQGHILALHRFQGTLSHLTLVQEQPRILGEQLLSNTEVSLLLPLLEQYPHDCPYEVLWASFHGSTSEKAIARARLKLQEMGPGIVSLIETGYLLTRHYQRRLRRKTDEDGGERDAPR